MRALVAAFVAAWSLSAGVACAQEPLKLSNAVELSGAGAVSGTDWRDGLILATEEINAKGGFLGRKVDLSHLDTQSNPGISRGVVQKILDDKPYVLFGPIFSGSVMVNMELAQQAEVAQITGAEAAGITQKGNPYIFRTSFGQQTSMPKIANYVRDDLKAKKVAVVWVNNDFGKGGRDSFVQEMKQRNIAVAADISTESGQADFAADVVKVKRAEADAVFVYTNEEESARFLREARKQSLAAPLIGETTLLSQKVIELAGDAANGVRGHIGLSADAPIPAIAAFKERFVKRFNYQPDHNGLKGFIGMYTVKYVTEKLKKFDGKAFAATLHGLTITPEDEPGILMQVKWDQNGDIDRESFLAEVVDGKQKIVKTLPRLGQ
jgi:branched-chain amino acid transport system substrate-binding protein